MLRDDIPKPGLNLPEALTKGQPTLKGCGIIYLSTVDWDFLWGRQQAIMAQFAANGTPVLYVEPLGIRSARPQAPADWRRILQRLQRHIGSESHTLWSPMPNVSVYSPLALPFQRPGWIHAVNGWWISRSLNTVTRHLHAERRIMWTSYATQTILRLIESWNTALGYDILVYDCIDDIANNPKGAARDYAACERKLVGRADLVFTSSARLAEVRRHLNSHVHHIPPGVDVDALKPNGPAPRDLALLPRPRLGFFGGFDERIDQQLILYLANARPDWHMVFIGNVRTPVDELLPHPNIHFLGQKTPDELGSYLGALDVFLIPYVINDYTRNIYPNKVFECLAVGKPTVATPLPELQSLAGLLRVAAPGDMFVAAVEAALSETESHAARRQAVASANTWAARYAEMRNWIESALATATPSVAGPSPAAGRPPSAGTLPADS
jgi:glycosyltransferase involved in cell wall biosynthesis